MLRIEQDINTDGHITILATGNSLYARLQIAQMMMKQIVEELELIDTDKLGSSDQRSLDELHEICSDSEDLLSDVENLCERLPSETDLGFFNKTLEYKND